MRGTYVQMPVSAVHLSQRDVTGRYILQTTVTPPPTANLVLISSLISLPVRHPVKAMTLHFVHNLRTRSGAASGLHSSRPQHSVLWLGLGRRKRGEGAENMLHKQSLLASKWCFASLCIGYSSTLICKSNKTRNASV
jgi:hypothetical protein